MENEEEIMNLLHSTNLDDIKLGCCILSKYSYKDVEEFFMKHEGQITGLGTHINISKPDISKREIGIYLVFPKMNFYIGAQAVRLKPKRLILDIQVKTINYE